MHQTPSTAESSHQDSVLTASGFDQTGGHAATPPPFQLKADQPAQLQATKDAPIQRTEPATVTRGGGTHTVVRGDSLWRIAEETYGRGSYWTQLRDANTDVVRGTSLILPGQELDLPAIDIPIMDALDSERDDQEDLRDLAQSIPEANYTSFREQLTQDELAAEGEFLQLVDMMRRTGMTIAEMAETQRLFMEGQAAAAGVSIGQYIADETASRGYGGGTVTWWPSLTPTQQADWTRRFGEARDWLRANAPDSVREVITEAESQGGGFQWAPEEAERLGAFGYTNSDWTLYVGQHWLEAYEAEQASVYANIVHEMGGHNEYGEEHGWSIMSEVLNQIDPAERAIAEGGGNSIFSAFGYMETEIWAELRENEFDRADNPTDHAFDSPDGLGRQNDVERQLRRIQHAFAPPIAEALVRSMAERALRDSRITPESYALFLDRIHDVFGFTP